MKALLVVVLLVMTVSYGSALKCRRCVPPRPGGRCTPTTEICSPQKDACVSARILSSPHNIFQRCIKKNDCKILQASSSIRAKCCQRDLCNISNP